MSDIKFSCPKCGTRLVVDESGAGMTVACPNCGQAIVIPPVGTEQVGGAVHRGAGKKTWVWIACAAVCVLAAATAAWFLLLNRAGAPVAGAPQGGTVALEEEPAAGPPPGSLDLSFDVGAGFEGQSGRVCDIAHQADGKVVIVGRFALVNGQPRGHIARLNPDGSLDAGFTPKIELETLPGAQVNAVVIQSDGKIVVGGVGIRSVNGVTRNHVTRLEPDGQLDDSFQPQLDPRGGVRAVALQSDGKLLAGGSFTNVADRTVNGLVRLNPDGSLDEGFEAKFDERCGVFSLAVQRDQCVLGLGLRGIGESMPQSFLTRLTAGGSPDPSFKVPVFKGRYPADAVRCMVLQQDGKIIVAGSFTNINGRPRQILARLNQDGTLDTGFDIGDRLLREH